MLEKLSQILARIRGEGRPEGDDKNYPLNLTESEVAVLKKLHGTDAWSVLVKVVDETCTMQNEKMLTADDAAELHDAKGYIRGARAPIKTIAFIIQQEENDERRRSEQRERAERERQRSRDLATFGHPARQSSTD